MIKKVASVTLSLFFASQSFASTKVLMDCTRDQRPVDGALTQYDIKQDDEDGKYSLFLTTGVSAWPHGPSEPQTTMLLEGLECSKPDLRNKSATLVCSVDKRPVDGLLNKLSVVKTEKKGYYSLILDKEGVSRVDRKVFKSKKIIERSIKCTFADK